MSKVIIVSEIQNKDDLGVISLEKFYQKRDQRRRRVAKRMLKRFPMFAVEFMQDEFEGYSHEEFVADVTRKTRKRKTERRKKSPLKRQGRYQLYERAMHEYRMTKEERYLREAQHWRNRLYLPYEVVFNLGGKRRTLMFPSTTGVEFVKGIASIKFKTWEELDEILKEKMRWAHLS